MNLQELEAELRRNAVHPVYLLLGPEAYLRRRALDLLKTTLLAPEAVAFNHAVFSLREHAMADILAAANTFPMLSSRRLVILEGLEAVEAASAALLVEYLRKPHARTVLVVVAS